MCIFPSDGTNRIRFTGQSAFYRSISAGNVRHPEDLCALRSMGIIRRKGAIVKGVGIVKEGQSLSPESEIPDSSLYTREPLGAVRDGVAK